MTTETKPPSLGYKSVLVYGRPKIGKTVDVHFATGGKALTILAEPGGLDSVGPLLGKEPEHVLLTDLSQPHAEAQRVLVKVAKGIVEKRWRSVIFDSFTAFAERVLMAHLESAKDGRLAYGRMERDVVDIVQRFLYLPNAWVFGIFHEQPGRMDERGATRGGPMVPGRFFHEQMVGMFSLVLRAYSDGNQRLYSCDPLSNAWATGDRFGVTTRVQPMDLRPLLWKVVKPGEPIPDFPEKKVEETEKGNF